MISPDRVRDTELLGVDCFAQFASLAGCAKSQVALTGGSLR